MRYINHSRRVSPLFLLILAWVFSTQAAGQDSAFTVSGHVYSAKTGLPLADIGISAANVPVEPVRTGPEGTFSITVSHPDEQLLISYPGYKETTLFIHGREEVKVWLHSEDEYSSGDPARMPFREVPYRNIAGAVETVRLLETERSTQPSFEQALQGTLRGLNVINRSGMPGEGAYLTCRGYSSLYASAIPLLVVDGMILKQDGFTPPIIQGFHHNPLADIDKRDISGITLLKDAASSGVYGIKSSNGILLISTIPPKGGKTTLDVSVSGGISTPPPQMPVMDAEHFSSFLMEQMYGAGMSSAEIFAGYPFLAFDPDYLYQSRYSNNTNWQDEIFRMARSSDAHLTVSGGDARARYSISGGYLSNEAVVKNSDYNRFNFRFNSVVQVSSSLDIGFNLGYTNARYDLMETGATPQTNPILASLIKSPLLTVYQKDRDGISLPVYDAVADFGISNPSVIVNEVEAYDATSKFLGVSYVGVRLSDRLTARAQFGLDRLKSNERIFIPSRGMAPQEMGSAERSVKVKVDQYYSILSEARISYANRFAYIHDLSLDGGARYQINRMLQDAGAAQNSATDEFKDLQSGKADEKSVSGREERWSWLNYFISANYILNDRYILMGNLSLDASSRFGPEADGGISIAGYPYALLPSAGAAWRISSESFIPEIPSLDELKLRVSYGWVGSDDFINYYTRLYYRTIPYYSVTGFTLNGLYNPGIKWELVRKANAGVDLSLFRERLVINADYYRSVTEDMITFNTLPVTYGYEYYITNGGSCENRGIEAGIYGKIMEGTLKWEMDAHFTRDRNEVLSLPDERIISSIFAGEKISVVGMPMGLFYGYRSLGVFSSREEADAANLVDKAGRRFNAGDLHFEDQDGNGIIDERDKTIIGDPHPDFTISLYNHFLIKGLSLSFLVRYVHGPDLFNYIRSRMESMSGFENQATSVYNRWVTDGQVTGIPGSTFGDPIGNSRFSSRWIEDGSYFRLSTLTLAYTFPRKLAFVNDLNIYLTGTNLFTATGYLGFDPEFSHADGVMGLGIDDGKIPQPRGVMIGLKVGL